MAEGEATSTTKLQPAPISKQPYTASVSHLLLTSCLLACSPRHAVWLGNYLSQHYASGFVVSLLFHSQNYANNV